MRFYFGKQDLRTLSRAEEFCFLLTNGLGGYVSATAAYSVPRADQGLLISAVEAPNKRITMIHRMRETLQIGDRTVFLSSQAFADGTKPEDGFRHLTGFCVDRGPSWIYDVSGVRVTRRIAMAWEANASAVVYEIENCSDQTCILRAEPFLKFAPKEAALEKKADRPSTSVSSPSKASTLRRRSIRITT